MNLRIDVVDLLRWLHFLTLGVGVGAAVVVLLLSGFEEGREDLQGLAATVWSKVVTWAIRLSIVVGIALLVLAIQGGRNPMKNGSYFHMKMLLVLILAGLTEMAPKALAAGRRGAALLMLVLFLGTSFVVFNKTLFGAKPRFAPAVVAAPAAAVPPVK